MKTNSKGVRLSLTYGINKRIRIIAVIIAIIILLVTPLSIVTFSTSNSYLYQLALLITALIPNVVFGLLVFALFGDKIDRWLGHGIKETPFFDAKSFLSQVRLSKKNVIIHETFIRHLIESHESDLKISLEAFYHNCLIDNPADLKEKVRILILHPFCESLKNRYTKLGFGPEYEEENLAFLSKLQTIQKHINEVTGNESFFIIKITYEQPDFSMYYCDMRSSISYYDDIPTVEAPQILIIEPFDSKVSKKHVAIFDKHWQSSIEYRTKQNSAEKTNWQTAVKNFRDLTSEKKKVEIESKLVTIAKLCFGNRSICVELVNYLEANHKRHFINYEDVSNIIHYNIFGTGGDKLKTINISTIASILASHHVNNDLKINGFTVLKSGTLAVTCKVGSQQFYDSLQSKLLDINSTAHIKNKDYLDYNSHNQSMYLPITYFGYIYREAVREMRKKIHEQGLGLDIYKVIFPTANFTNYDGVINGISDILYLDYYQMIYAENKKTGIIVFNSNGIDEIFEGDNTLYFYKSGEYITALKFSIIIEETNKSQFDNFFSESDPEKNVRQNVTKFFDLFRPNSETNRQIKEIICYNIALFTFLHLLVNNNYTQKNASNHSDFSEIKLKKFMMLAYQQFFEPYN